MVKILQMGWVCGRKFWDPKKPSEKEDPEKPLPTLFELCTQTVIRKAQPLALRLLDLPRSVENHLVQTQLDRFQEMPSLAFSGINETWFDVRLTQSRPGRPRMRSPGMLTV